MAERAVSHDPGALRGALGWVSRRFGPIRSLSYTEHAPPQPRWSVYTCEISRAPAGTYYQQTVNFAAGASVDPDEALRRALGEAIERYSGMHPPDPGRLFPLTPRESPLTELFPRCAPEEPCPPSLRGLDRDKPVTHTLMRHLSDGCEVPVPAGHVYLDFPRLPDEPPVAQSISTGLSFHPDLVRALWGGLCEVAERDAVMLTWWARRAVRPIACRGDLPDPLRRRIARLAEVGLRAHLYDVTTDFRVPTVFCLLVGPAFPLVVCGASCGGDAFGACTKAIDEAVSVRHFLVAHGPQPVGIDRFDQVRTLADHTLLYGSWEGSPALDFLLRARRPPIPFTDFAAEAWWTAPRTLDELRERARELEARGLTVLWSDLTIPEAAALGRVVKVVVPQMLPLSPDHRVRWLATPRLLRLAGLSAPDPSALNPYPHPFA